MDDCYINKPYEHEINYQTPLSRNVAEFACSLSSGHRGAPMNLKLEENNEVTIIYVNEERLDAHNSGDLKVEMQQLFEGGKKNVLVDLKDVRFIDSSGLGVLVSGFKNAISHQGNLKLSSLQPQVKSMFELTRLHRVFEIFTSTSEALDNF